MTLSIHVRALHTVSAALIENLSIHVPGGAIHTLMGGSGSGKSSLLAAICGTLAPGLVFDGSVELNGQALDALPTQARRVAILFQDDLLFAHMTVRENLLFATPAGPQAARETAVRQALTDVEMQAHLHANPATLSGGQRARISLTRALLAQPNALLLDEPFSKLDADLRVRMRALVFGMVAARGIPALLVSHDLADVADAAHLTILREPTHLAAWPARPTPQLPWWRRH
jgi:putative thiamine transport system ATP-binding protein